MSELLADLMRDRRLMKEASSQLRERGFELARAEAEYQSAKSARALELKADGMPATMISLVIKGDKKVAGKMFERDCAQVRYDSAKEALQVYKLDARMLEAQIDREWRG